MSNEYILYFPINIIWINFNAPKYVITYKVPLIKHLSNMQMIINYNNLLTTDNFNTIKIAKISNIFHKFVIESFHILFIIFRKVKMILLFYALLI